MDAILRITIFALGLVFVAVILYLLVKRRINERNSFFWLAGAFVIIVLSVIPDILEVLSRAAGVDYPPALLFLLATLVILFILMHQSIQISILHEKCRELTENIALINFNENSRQEHKIVAEEDEEARYGKHTGN